MSTRSALDHYRLLGRSGIRVSPLALGTMTFGSDWGWGTDAAGARQIFDAYVEAGGNFIDTAVNYTNGASERILGQLMKGRRERLVISTKYTMARNPGDPNSGGNQRLNLMRSVETSLRQLDTDRIDLLYLHAWDFTTGAEEVMRGLDDLVRSGKVVYLGICNTPAWKVAQMQTLAELRGWSPLVALQIEYSLVERTVEHELLPMAREMGLGVMPWSPLGGGVLTGKYGRDDLSNSNEAGIAANRKGVISSSGHLTERSLQIASVVVDIAGEIGAKPSQVALAWTLQNPAVVAPIIGARTLAQAEDNLKALSIELDQSHIARLDQASAPELIFPGRFVAKPMVQQLVFGGIKLQGRAG
ncbi:MULTISPECIES: aldo/keto reductase [Pseudomonas]|jgi:aryl-alcohol dehydrogenase-like predicted oxidoreductase|uniref:aldo/keto reductase n=1 Tax=Pseudomonas TaxID=286 RepID=UPI0010712B97|nr:MULTISPECIES: aldo/keto reductase [Pseudomonas]QBR32137.1 aldo/keto reductase [Pseudomonas sp. S150]UZT90302.1 aldo/keto reductase [Pseudomonas koreensis]